jgi:hypothetical protein
MAIAYFPCLVDADTIEVTFFRPAGGAVALRLLVDSGFTGQSSFVLSDLAHDLAYTTAPSSQAAGAIQGRQHRVVVFCRVPGLPFQSVAIAILADLAPLALPAGVQGIAGLKFLRQFRRCGAEQDDLGAWRFFLADS